MNEQIKNIGKNITEFWGKLSKKKRYILIFGIALLIVLALIITFFLNRKNYVVLFKNMDEKETVEVLQQLQDSKVDYEYENDGTILIPEQQENVLRMQLAQSGHPRTGIGYDLFTDNINFMSTDYEKKKYEVFQLQDRLQNSIETIDGVDEAIVTINIPEEKSFAWETDKEEASASVKLNLAYGVTLTTSQTNGIIKLVSKSIPGLKEDNIALVDTDGNSLKPEEDELHSNVIKLKLEIEKEFEKDTIDNVGNFLATLYGPDNVQVSAKCDINFDKKISEMLKYIPDEETKKGVPSDTENEREITGPGETVGGVPGSETNSEVPTYPGVTFDGDDIYFKDKNSIKYLVSQLKEQVEHNPGNVEDLTVAVAINKEYMSEEELTNVKELVANSAGISPDKIALHNMEFYNPEAPVPASDQNPMEQDNTLRNILIYGGIALAVIAILAIIIIIIVNKRRKKKAAEAATENTQDNAEMWKDIQSEIKVQETEETVIKRQLKDFTNNNPEIAAQLLRTWLKGDDR